MEEPTRTDRQSEPVPPAVELPGAGPSGAQPPRGTEPPSGARRRSGRGAHDLIVSLLILLLPVLLLVGGYQLLSGRQQAVEVDPTPAYAQASAAGLAVTGSADPGSDWVPVSAQFDSHATGGTLRVGYVTPAGDPVQVVHSTVPPEVLLPERLPDAGPPSGEVQLDGENWQWYAGRSGEQALVRMAPDLTTIVVGDADEAELRHLATHS